MERENPFDSNPVGNFSHGEGRPNASLFLTDHNAFKGLDPLLIAFHNFHMDPYRISHSEIGKVCSKLFPFDHCHDVHHLTPSIYSVRRIKPLRLMWFELKRSFQHLRTTNSELRTKNHICRLPRSRSKIIAT